MMRNGYLKVAVMTRVGELWLLGIAWRPLDQTWWLIVVLVDIRAPTPKSLR